MFRGSGLVKAVLKPIHGSNGTDKTASTENMKKRAGAIKAKGIRSEHIDKCHWILILVGAIPPGDMRTVFSKPSSSV